MSEQAKQPTVEQLQKQLAEALELTDQQAETIKALEAERDALLADPAVRPQITVDRKTYKVQVDKFRYKRKGDNQTSREYTAAELLKDEALQKELIDKQVGFLELVVETPKGK